MAIKNLTPWVENLPVVSEDNIRSRRPGPIQHAFRPRCETHQQWNNKSRGGKDQSWQQVKFNDPRTRTHNLPTKCSLSLLRLDEEQGQCPQDLYCQRDSQDSDDNGIRSSPHLKKGEVHIRAPKSMTSFKQVPVQSDFPHAKMLRKGHGED